MPCPQPYLARSSLSSPPPEPCLFQRVPSSNRAPGQGGASMEHHDCRVKERPLAFSVLLSKVWLCKMKKLAVVLVVDDDGVSIAKKSSTRTRRETRGGATSSPTPLLPLPLRGCSQTIEKPHDIALRPLCLIDWTCKGGRCSSHDRVDRAPLLKALSLIESAPNQWVGPSPLSFTLPSLRRRTRHISMRRAWARMLPR